MLTWGKVSLVPFEPPVNPKHSPKGTHSFGLLQGELSLWFCFPYLHFLHSHEILCRMNYFLFFILFFYLILAERQVQNANHLKQGCLILIYVPYSTSTSMNTSHRYSCKIFTYFFNSTTVFIHPERQLPLPPFWTFWVAVLHGPNGNVLTDLPLGPQLMPW